MRGLAVVCWLIVSIVLVILAIALGGWGYTLFLLVFGIIYLYAKRNDN